MARRSSGFINKKPHRKSRGGCFTCKRKKVKCDEGQPTCTYCSLRKLSCDYPPESRSTSPGSIAVLSESSNKVSYEGVDFNNASTSISSWLMPATQAASGFLYTSDFELLHHYKTFTWQTLTVRDDKAVVSLHKDSIPQLSLSHSHLLYALLSIAASHSNTLAPSKQAEQLALKYRQRTFSEYNKVLQNITVQNYESILVTGMLLLSLVTPPDPDVTDSDAYLIWMDTFLKMSEGLRILASLRWAAGIEKLSVYPLVCRELRALPPPPIFHTSEDRHLHTRVGMAGTTPDYPNPPSTYYLRNFEASPVFLPPSLMDLLTSLNHPEAESDPIDLHANTLYPVLHAFSPIFLSLYYYHLDPDFFVRVFVFCSFLMPDFLLLVKSREPRTLVLIAWWFALASLAPRGWWIGNAVENVVEAVGKTVRLRGDAVTKRAFESVDSIIRVLHNEGSEAAARSIFEKWKDVCWEDGKKRAEEWEASLSADWTAETSLNTQILNC